MQAGAYFALPVAVTMPAAICTGSKPAVDDVGVAFDAAGADREDHPHPSYRPVSTPAMSTSIGASMMRRWASDLGTSIPVAAIGALAHVELTAFKVDIGPAQPAQFRGAESWVP